MGTENVVDNLIKCNQTQCCVEGLSYKDALELIIELGVRRVDSHIVTGGVQIHANVKDSRVIRICDMFHTKPTPGTTMKRENAILRKPQPS